MGEVVNINTIEQRSREQLKDDICKDIDKGNWVMTISYDIDEDKLIIGTSFDSRKYKVFTKGMLKHASDCFHDLVDG